MKVILQKRGQRGYALLLVLSLAACAMIVLTATLMRTATDSDLTARDNQYNAGVCAAEAATEKVLARMRYDYASGQDTMVSNNLSLYRGFYPSITENAYWSGFQFSDGQGNLNRTYVAPTTTKSYQTIEYEGLSGWVTTYRILSNVSQTTRANFTMTNAVQQDVILEEVPVFQYAIFYNSLLEFTWAATLTVNGRVNSNTNIYVGSQAALTFNSTVTASGTITDPPWAGYAQSQFTGAINYNGVPGYITNTPVLQLPIGTNNTPAAVQAIITMPPAGESPTSPMGEQRYYNKADIIILVSNTTVSTTIQFPNIVGDASPVNISTNYNPTNTASYTNVNNTFPFLTLTNYFEDQRENNKIVKVSQIDVGKLNNWLLTSPSVTGKFTGGSGSYPNVLYIADNRSDAATTNGTEFYAVRLTNGAAIPTNGGTGFTIATPDPLYVWGNYNDPTGAGTTSVVGTQPASLVSDALTLLTSNWKDNASSNYSTGDVAREAAATDTVGAAIITGVVYSTGSGSSQFSGGVMNLPRLLEDWSTPSSKLYLNTSIVNLFQSAIATNQFQLPGAYYNAPTRFLTFNTNFLNVATQPPGTPSFGMIQKSKWTVPPPGNISYNGY